MARILVDCAYQGENYVLRFAEGENKGKVCTTLFPNTVVSIGSALFFVRGRRPGSRNMTIHEITRNQAQLSAKKIIALLEGKEGQFLRSGVSRWATNSSAAHRKLIEQID